MSLSGNVITAAPATGYTYADPAYTVTLGTATVAQSGNEFTVSPSSDCTVQINFAAIPPHTVTLSDDTENPLTEAYGGAGVELPSRSDIGDYTFAGWSETDVATETTTAPAIIPVGNYTPTANVTLYPVYTNGAQNNTASKTIEEYASDNWWLSGVKYESVTLDANVTAEADGGDNTGKYYESNHSWRFYANEGGVLTISTTSGELTSVTITYSGNTLTYNNNNVTSGTAVSVSGTSASFYVSGASGNTQVTAISVSYTVGSGATYYVSSHNATFAAGSGGEGWSISPVSTIPGQTVTVSYSGDHRVMSVSTSVDVSNTGNDYTFTMPGYDVAVTTALYPYVEKEVTAAQWVAISSPVNNNNGDEDTSWVTNLTSGSYDLFGYDEEYALWRNAKNNGGAAGFSTLTKGLGYIYRRNSTDTLHFNGDYNTENVTLTNLSYTPANGDLAGWHLVGNPFNMTLTTNAVYYSLSADGAWVRKEGDTIQIGEAILIYVSNAVNSVTFDYAAGTMTITSGGAKNTPALPKGFCLGGNNGSINQPIAQPSNLPFALWNGDQLEVTIPGTLEAYDMMGRRLFIRQLNCFPTALPATLFPGTGVYVLRLDGMSQKIVIR